MTFSFIYSITANNWEKKKTTGWLFQSFCCQDVGWLTSTWPNSKETTSNHKYTNLWCLSALPHKFQALRGGPSDTWYMFIQESIMGSSILSTFSCIPYLSPWSLDSSYWSVTDGLSTTWKSKVLGSFYPSVNVCLFSWNTVPRKCRLDPDK